MNQYGLGKGRVEGSLFLCLRQPRQRSFSRTDAPGSVHPSACPWRTSRMDGRQGAGGGGKRQPGKVADGFRRGAIFAIGPRCSTGARTGEQAASLALRAEKDGPGTNGERRSLRIRGARSLHPYGTRPLALRFSVQLARRTDGPRRARNADTATRRVGRAENQGQAWTHCSTSPAGMPVLLPRRRSLEHVASGLQRADSFHQARVHQRSQQIHRPLLRHLQRGPDFRRLQAAPLAEQL